MNSNPKPLNIVPIRLVEALEKFVYIIELLDNRLNYIESEVFKNKKSLITHNKEVKQIRGEIKNLSKVIEGMMTDIDELKAEK